MEGNQSLAAMFNNYYGMVNTNEDIDKYEALMVWQNTVPVELKTEITIPNFLDFG